MPTRRPCLGSRRPKPDHSREHRSRLKDAGIVPVLVEARLPSEIPHSMAINARMDHIGQCRTLSVERLCRKCLPVLPGGRGGCMMNG